MNNKHGQIRILNIHDPDEVSKLEYIQSRAWGTSEVVPSHIFIAASTVEGIVKGAYLDDKLVGFVFGFLGKYGGRLCLYSHQLAVLPEYQDRDIGFHLKNAQREYAAALGLDLVVWTYDPLQSKNAYFNINKLGCIVKKYFINHYGEMRDELNKGLPSDRFMCEWWIKSRWVENKEASRYKYFEDYPLKGKINIALETVSDNGLQKPNIIYEGFDKYIGVEIPRHINEIKRKDIKLARKWRLATRNIFKRYLSRNYVVYRYMLYRENPEKGIYLLVRGFNINEYREI